MPRFGTLAAAPQKWRRLWGGQLNVDQLNEIVELAETLYSRPLQPVRPFPMALAASRETFAATHRIDARSGHWVLGPSVEI